MPETHFALGYAGSPGIRVTPETEVTGTDEKGLPAGKAKVSVTAWTENAKDGQQVTFTLGGQSKCCTVADGCAEAEFELENAHLWNGLDDPYLYTIQAELYADGEKMDQVSARFGCRQMKFDPENGFFLNGRSYPLRGVSRHQDRAGVGNALTKEMHRKIWN